MPTGLPALWRALTERVVAENLAALGSDLLAVACLGSVARKEPTAESDLGLYLATRHPVSPLLDPRPALTGRIRSSPEYQRLLCEGYRPDPMLIFHSAALPGTPPWILLDTAGHGVILCDPEGVLVREIEAVGNVFGNWEAGASSGLLGVGAST